MGQRPHCLADPASDVQQHLARAGVQQLNGSVDPRNTASPGSHFQG